MQLVGESVAAESGTQWDWDFLASPGNRANWVPKWGFKTHAPTFDPRFDIGGQFGGWHYGVKAYGGYGGVYPAYASCGYRAVIGPYGYVRRVYACY